MKNRHSTVLLATTLLTFLLLSPHAATAGHGRQGAIENSTLNIGITFVNPAWSAPRHRAIEQRVHYVQDRHGHPAMSPRFQTYKNPPKHGRHFRKAHWQKKHHRPHSYYR